MIFGSYFQLFGERGNKLSGKQVRLPKNEQKTKKRHISKKPKISKIFRKMGIYILFFRELYYNSGVI